MMMNPRNSQNSPGISEMGWIGGCCSDCRGGGPYSFMNSMYLLRAPLTVIHNRECTAGNADRFLFFIHDMALPDLYGPANLNGFGRGKNSFTETGRAEVVGVDLHTHSNFIGLIDIQPGSH